MPVEVHLAHHGALAELGRSAEDYATLVASLESAHASNQSPGEGTRAVLERFESNPQRLEAQLFEIRGSTPQENRRRNRFDGYSGMVADAASLTHTLLSEQAAFVANLDNVRQTGPRVVERMRDIRLDDSARDTFALVVGTLEYAKPGAEVGDYQLANLVTTLRQDRGINANMPGEVGGLLDAVNVILDNKPRLQARLSQLGEIPIVTSGANLSAAAEDLYSDTLATIDRARTLLSIYAILLLAAAAVITFRLSQSYQILNRVNADLADLNSSLESRVTERTEALEQAVGELKESQVQLVHAEKMSSLGQLVAGISHEINTPLLYLANNAELIQERLDLMEAFMRRCSATFSLRAEDFDDRKTYQLALAKALKDLHTTLRQDDLLACIDEAEELLHDSTAGLADLTELAQGLKDFSRLDRAPIENFDINSGLERSLLIARGALKHKANISKFFGDLPEIQCAPSQLNQVFLNLLTNAAQAIEEHGEIVIKTECIEDTHVSITISDTGCGISAEDLAKVRDPFFTTKSVGTGTGLGLSIVEQIIQAHGGELKIESVLGKGSAFTIMLPVRHDDMHSGASDSSADTDFADQLAAAG